MKYIGLDCHRKFDYAILHKALQTALKWGMVTHNVADGVDVPKAKRFDDALQIKHDNNVHV